MRYRILFHTAVSARDMVHLLRAMEDRAHTLVLWDSLKLVTDERTKIVHVEVGAETPGFALKDVETILDGYVHGYVTDHIDLEAGE